jgi:hypothetical protein
MNEFQFCDSIAFYNLGTFCHISHTSTGFLRASPNAK